MRILFVGFAVIDIIDSQKYFGGAGGSMSINAATLGISSSFFGPLSNDENGKFLQSRLQAAGVDLSLCDMCSPSVPTCEIVDPFGHGSTRKWEDHGAMAYFESMALSVDALRQFDRIFLCNAPPGIGEKIAAQLDEKKLLYIPGPKSVSVSNWVRPAILQKSEVVFANEEEAPFVWRENPFSCGVRMVATTYGGKGGAVHVPDGKKFYFRPVRNIHVVDTTGAGDAWALGFAKEWIQSKNVRSAIKSAKELAARCIQRKGGLL